jgi:hypothetical protein
MDTTYYQMDEKSPLSSYAFLPGFPFKLRHLARIAEPENWYYDHDYFNVLDTPEIAEVKKKYSVLFQYIHHTFSKAMDDNLVIESPDGKNSIMNTGLLTIGQEEIFMLFRLNDRTDAQKWLLDGFYAKSAHEIPISLRSKLPDHIDYFKGRAEDMYFNLDYEIIPNIEHIITQNFTRLPKALQSLGDMKQIASILDSLVAQMKKRILRNHRLVVPQYYNKKIMYLAPLVFGDETIVLGIEKNENSYRANTILTLGMAYCNARLLMKPESNWLVLK